MSLRRHHIRTDLAATTKPLALPFGLPSGSLSRRRKRSVQTSRGEGAEERRRHPRVPIVLMVRYAPRQYGPDTPPELLVGQTVNISRMGVALEISHRLRLGGLIEMSLIQQNPLGCVDVVGRVAWCQPQHYPGSDDAESPPLRYLVGVEFSRLLSIRELRTLHESALLDAY
jgi:hypothetical protein